MALSDYQSEATIARSKRGSIERNLGGKSVVTDMQPKQSQSFVQKISDIGQQTGDILATGLEKGAKFVANSAVDIAKAGYGTLKTAVDLPLQTIQSSRYENASRELGAKQNDLDYLYKNGNMSKEDYIKATLDIVNSLQDINKENAKIYSGPTPIQRVMDIAETAVNVLTLGSFELTNVGAKTAVQLARQGAKQVAKEEIEALVDQAGKNFAESQLLKIPALKQLVVRNLESGAKREIQKLAGENVDQFLLREGRNIAADLLIKRPIFYQANVGGGKEVYDKILEGNYPGALKSSAWLATQMLEGGPIGAFFNVTGWAKRGIGQLTYGNQSFIDELSRRIGDGNGSQIARFLTTTKQKAPNEFKEIEKVFRVLQEGNLRSADNDVKRAVDNLVAHYEQNNIPLESLTPSQIYKDMTNWVKADELWNDLAVKKGLIPGIDKLEATKYTPVRWDATTRDGIARAFAGVGPELQARQELLNRLSNQPGAGWAQNTTLMRQLETILSKEQTGKDVARAIQGIDSAVLNANLPKRIAKQFADLGYTIAMPEGGRVKPFVDVSDTRKLISSAIKGNTEIFDPATAPHPTMQSIARGLQIAGLSPESADQRVYQELSRSVVASLEDVNLKRSLGFTAEGNHVSGGQAILSRLQSYVENKKPSKIGQALTGFRQQASALTDIRQMTVHEISEALSTPGSKFSISDAKQVSKAVMQGYLDVPLEFRGLGDKVVDALYRYNPLQKYYSRLQSALRYTYNPFFALQEGVETSALSGLSGGNRLTNLAEHNLIWRKSREELEGASRLLDDSGIFVSSLPGEAAQDRVLGRITANITPGQKRDLAGLALDIAKAKGQTLDDLVKNSPEEIADALRVIVQYPNKGILSSSLARTLNTVFFPIRYNVKVTQIAAKVLAKQPPSVQKAVIHSLFDMRDWLKSDEGIAWQAAHADAIQLFNWITPTNSITYTMNLLSHKPDSMAELGALGGLPLGAITQILDSQGIININKPYVNPKTGDVFPDYIPNSMKARASVALTDLLGSTFNYPGRVLGLPGKEATLKKFVQNFIATNGKDFDKRLDIENLTPLQQRWVQVLKGDTSKEAIDALYNAPAPGQYNGYTIPPLELPWKQPLVERRTNLPKKASRAKGTKAKKVSLPMPQ